MNPVTPLKKSWWWAMAMLYCLSGLTSLAFEVLWARMLSLQFGISIFGVALTVAAFMIGLGLGSLAGLKWAQNTSRPLRWFALFEMAIAFYALCLPDIQHAIGGWTGGIAVTLTLAQWYLLQGVEALLLLILPAFAMGAGFAMILKAAEPTPLTLGSLYGLNTLGGVLGALLPLWMLPLLGWAVSVRSMAVLGLLVSFSAMALSYVAGPGISHLKQHADSRPAALILMMYAGIGAGSIMLEIGWVRLYGMVMLRTEYVIGVILAVYLVGVALGSILLPLKHKNLFSLVMPLIAGGGVLASVWLLPVISGWVERSHVETFSGTLWSQALMLGVITLPVTLALGAWLPLLASHYDKTETSGVWLYGANCLGGAFGAIAACLVFIPWMGSTAMVVFAGLLIAGLGLAREKSRSPWLVFVVMLLLAWPLRNMPPVHDLLPNIEADSLDLYLYEDAVSLTHVIQQKDGQRVLLSDLQRMDASTDPGAVEIQKDQARLALLLHPDPRSILFLGMGTGISMAGSLPFKDLNRTAVELSQGAIVAAKDWFATVNENALTHAQVDRDDARHFLISSERHYDVIVGDLFHPDLAGMGSLLSVQQFARARDHLKSGGLFVQWLALNQFDIQSLAVVLRSFRRVFPDAQLFMDGMHLAMVGPREKMAIARSMLVNVGSMKQDMQDQATGGEGIWTWLGRYWGPIPASEGNVQDEWVPNIEFDLPRARYDGSMNLADTMSWLLSLHPDPDAAMAILGISAADKSRFGRAYVATELAVRGWVASIQGDAEQAGRLIWLSYQANPQDHWIASALADNMMQSLPEAGAHGLSKREALLRILKVYSGYVPAIRELWHLEQAAGNRQQAAHYRLQLQTLSPLDEEVSLSR